MSEPLTSARLCPNGCGPLEPYGEADIGVGVQQFGPWGCPVCHFVEDDSRLEVEATGGLPAALSNQRDVLARLHNYDPDVSSYYVIPDAIAEIERLRENAALAVRVLAAVEFDGQAYAAIQEATRLLGGAADETSTANVDPRCPVRIQFSDGKTVRCIDPRGHAGYCHRWDDNL